MGWRTSARPKFRKPEMPLADFARAVKGDDVSFAALRWSDLLADWASVPALTAHAKAIRARFGPL